MTELADGQPGRGISAPTVRRWMVQGFALGVALGVVVLLGFLLSG